MPEGFRSRRQLDPGLDGGVPRAACREVEIERGRERLGAGGQFGSALEKRREPVAPGPRYRPRRLPVPPLHVEEELTRPRVGEIAESFLCRGQPRFEALPRLVAHGVGIRIADLPEAGDEGVAPVVAGEGEEGVAFALLEEDAGGGEEVGVAGGKRRRGAVRGAGRGQREQAEEEAGAAHRPDVTCRYG